MCRNDPARSIVPVLGRKPASYGIAVAHHEKRSDIVESQPGRVTAQFEEHTQHRLLRKLAQIEDYVGHVPRAALRRSDAHERFAGSIVRELEELDAVSRKRSRVAERAYRVHSGFTRDSFNRL